MYCDMPFVTSRLLWQLAEESVGFDVFVPRHGGYLQPLCAVYSKQTLSAYHDFIASGGRRIFDIYPDLNTGYLDMDEARYGNLDELFLNVNTPEELEAARARSSRDFHTFPEKLAAEFLDASKNEGAAIKKRDAVLRMAEANRAFSHFRF